ncbi:hypothetical protein V6N13_035525 [Hibiscus sabdariffa]|uniref:F-box domain-containing protein n=1 Tax=Hibiscus sabdariffa TaxID=183260 RepID=A0ABR2S930_9ROSI
MSGIQGTLSLKMSISFFPDEILLQIISFLPLETAVNTTFLSKRWNGLWKRTFMELETTMQDFVVTIADYLRDLVEQPECSQLKNEGRLKLKLGQGRLLFVYITPMGKYRRTLRLEFSGGEQESGSFDCFLPPGLLRPRYEPTFHCQHGEEILELVPQLPPYQNIQHCITSLYLISASQLSSKELTGLLANLPYLESLIIESCDGLRSLDIEDAGRLQKLTVLDCPRLQSICFQGPCLQCFRYRGQLVSFKFEASCDEFDFDIKAPYYNYGTFLEDVMLDLRQGPVTKWNWDVRTTVLAHGLKIQCYVECTDSECFKKILSAIDRVKSLTICRWFFEQTMCKNVYSSSGGPEFSFDRLKELWWIDCSMGNRNMNVLLCFLRHCLKLERLYVTNDPECYDLSSSTDKFPATVIAPGNLRRLEFVTLEGFADEETENFAARQLIPLFGERNPVIKSKSGGKCVKHLVKVAELETEGKYPYKFEVVENVVGHFPNHVHMNL